ncbi:MAG: Squalene-hopene cyclase C-terminal domain [Candidatus Marinimicrobia bacterium]|jgi:hypothetical protein|nr:Squalene-hopene cyclase C-terminal domain [Candidatus Neomarinimicrobiota bacterium]
MKNTKKNLLPFPEIPENLSWFSNRFTNDPIQRILRSRNSQVKYYLYKNVFQMDPMAIHLKVTKRELNENRNRIKILKSLELFDPATQYAEYPADQQKALQLNHLTSLLSEAWDYNCHKRMTAIQNVFIHILKHQNKDGSFPLPLHLNAHVIETLLKYDFEGNRFVEQSIRWLVRQQNEDGGWGTSDEGSDVWLTLKVLSACSYHSIMRERKKIKRGADFILNHYLSLNKGGILEGLQAWDQLSYGYEGIRAFRGGTLKVLEVLVRLGYTAENKSIRKMLNWLESQQNMYGLWSALPRQAKDTTDDWVSYRVIRVLQLYYLLAGDRKPIRTFKIKSGGRTSSKKPRFLIESNLNDHELSESLEENTDDKEILNES